jgi:hypothetical protein
MKAVMAKTAKTEMAGAGPVNLSNPKKAVVKSVASKVDTKPALQDRVKADASKPAKPIKTTIEKVAAKIVTTKTGTAKVDSSKDGKAATSKPGVAKITVAKPVVAKSEATKSDVKKSTAKKVSATKATKSKELAKPETMKLLDNKQARPSREDIEQMIAKAAYFRAEKRCFEVGHEQEDWLMAEREINQLYLLES